MPIPDIIDALVGITAGDARDSARRRRPDARAHAQGSFRALLVPRSVAEASLAERAAVGLFVARLHRQPAAERFYGALLRETGRDLGAGAGEALEPLILAEAERAAASGPYGAFRADTAPSPFDPVRDRVDGPIYQVSSLEVAYALGDRLSAALEHAHLLVLRPRAAAREHLQSLLDAGWSTTGIVTLSQLVAFLTFQLRVVWGLAALGSVGAGTPVESAGLEALAAEVAREAEPAGAEAAESSSARTSGAARERLPEAPRVTEPRRFTQASLGWKPWLATLPVAEFTERHYEALVERDRVHMPYFRLLARDPDALHERTLTDLDIFFNTDGGLPRAERELAAAAASRLNACVFCASVHARFAVENGADRVQVQRLLDEGVAARLSARLDAVVDATVALTVTPPEFGTTELDRLREAGLDELSLLDVILAGSFFNWANRLMLSIGEPHE